MEKFYKITIPKPCHEDWNAMNSTEKGRFCSSCNTTVIDFTKLSTAQVQEFFQENKHKKICGHFRKTQLDTIHISIPMAVLQKEIFF